MRVTHLEAFLEESLLAGENGAMAHRYGYGYYYTIIDLLVVQGSRFSFFRTGNLGAPLTYLIDSCLPSVTGLFSKSFSQPRP